jgi:nitrogen-specific signal transduction histidine kinase
MDDTVNGVHQCCLSRLIRQQAEQDRLEKLVKPLIEEVNGGSPEALAKAIHAVLTRSHRTLQQGFWSAVKLAINEYAALPPSMATDLRNADAHKWANEVRRIDKPGVRFPLI